MTDNEFKLFLEKIVISKKWVKEHLVQLLDLFPLTPTHMANIDVDKFDEKLKSLNIIIENQYQFDSLLFVFETLNIIIKDGYLIKRNINFNPDCKINV